MSKIEQEYWWMFVPIRELLDILANPMSNAQLSFALEGLGRLENSVDFHHLTLPYWQSEDLSILEGLLQGASSHADYSPVREKIEKMVETAPHEFLKNMAKDILEYL